MYNTQIIEKEGKAMLADIDVLLLSIPIVCTKWLTSLLILVITTGYSPHTWSMWSTVKKTKNHWHGWCLLYRYDMYILTKKKCKAVHNKWQISDVYYLKQVINRLSMKASKGGKGKKRNEECPKKENMKAIFIKKKDKDPWCHAKKFRFYPASCKLWGPLHHFKEENNMI